MVLCYPCPRQTPAWTETKPPNKKAQKEGTCMVSVQTVAEGWAARGSQQMGTHSGLQGQKEVSGDILPAAAVSSGCTGLVRS